MKYDIRKSGMYIQRLRMEHGYTQEGLARELNIDRSYLSRVESGKRGCSLDVLVQLSGLLNVSLDCLILGEEQANLLKRNRKEELIKTIDRLIDQLENLKASL